MEDRAFHKQQEEERVVAEIGDRKEKEENRERMGRMEASRDEFLEQIRQERFEAQKVSYSSFIYTLIMYMIVYISGEAEGV